MAPSSGDSLYVTYHEFEGEPNMGTLYERIDGVEEESLYRLRRDEQRAQFGLHLLGLAIELLGSDAAAEAALTGKLPHMSTEHNQD